MDIGLACLTECQNAVVVCPDSVLPDASVIVPEIIIGISTLRSSATISIANKAAFAFRVSKIVSTIIRSAPPSNKADVATLNVSTNWSKLIFLNEGSSTSGLNEHVRLVGPKTPATKISLGFFFLKLSTALRAICAAEKLRSCTRSAIL